MRSRRRRKRRRMRRKRRGRGEEEKQVDEVDLSILAQAEMDLVRGQAKTKDVTLLLDVVAVSTRDPTTRSSLPFASDLSDGKNEVTTNADTTAMLPHDSVPAVVPAAYRPRCPRHSPYVSTAPCQLLT